MQIKSSTQRDHPMKPFRYKPGPKAKPATKVLQCVVRHTLAVPGAIAICSILITGPDRIYDYLTDVNTAILYKSVEKAIDKFNAHDTSSNHIVISKKNTISVNQIHEINTVTFPVIFNQNDTSSFIDYEDDTSGKIVTTAAVAQHRLNEMIELSTNPAAAQFALNNLLVDFESYRADLKPLVLAVFIMLWVLLAGISFAIWFGINSRRERKTS